MIPEIVESIKARLDLAEAMVAALKADAFEKPAEPEDIVFWEGEVIECKAELAAELARNEPAEKSE